MQTFLSEQWTSTDLWTSLWLLWWWKGLSLENLLLTQTLTLINQHSPIPVTSHHLSTMDQWSCPFLNCTSVYPHFCLWWFSYWLKSISWVVPFCISCHSDLQWHLTPIPRNQCWWNYSALIHRRNKQACEDAIHKATGKRNSVMLVNLLNLLRDTRQSGGENYQEGQLSWTFRTYSQRITQTQQSRHQTTYLSIQESLRLEFVKLVNQIGMDFLLSNVYPFNISLHVSDL